MQPLIEWQVCGDCNYHCSYCIQSAKNRHGCPDRQATQQMVDFFCGLTGCWEIKMSGGEPFAHPGFLDVIVTGLIERSGHLVSLLTNLSADKDVLDQFAGLTMKRLGIVSASLHLESTTVEEFLEKALFLRSRMDPAGRLVVNAVLVPGQLSVIEQAAREIRAAGLKFFPQLMKTKTGVVAYQPEEVEIIDRITGDKPTPRDANMVPSYKGMSCLAGCSYFVVSQEGDVWSCRSARRQKEGQLGNILRGDVQLRKTGVFCSYDLCPCTTPANRGMINPSHRLADLQVSPS